MLKLSGDRKSAESQRGATLVEFAIAVLLLLTLIFVNACREGARFGVVVRSPRYSDAEIRAAIVSRATDRLVTFNPANTLNLTFTRLGPGCVNMSDCTLRIDASYRYTFLILPNLIRIIKPLGIDPPASTLISEAVAMRYE
jgi:hypothetical protein